MHFTDQTGREVSITRNPKRIISLVPSQTELLHDLGLENEVAGITKFCVHPSAWFQTKTRVGGTKQINTGIVQQLQPDLVIANKEENVKEQIEELEKSFPVWVSDVNNLDDAYQMMEEIGTITNRYTQAKKIIDQVKENFAGLPANDSRPMTCYLIWQKPYMTVGGDTFIHSMMEAAGFENMYKNKRRYPELSIEELTTHQPDLLLLSSEPFPFKQKHIDELQSYLPDTKIVLTDGEMFSWYGSRLLQAPDYFSNLMQQIKDKK